MNMMKLILIKTCVNYLYKTRPWKGNIRTKNKEANDQASRQAGTERKEGREDQNSRTVSRVKSVPVFTHQELEAVRSGSGDARAERAGHDVLKCSQHSVACHLCHVVLCMERTETSCLSSKCWDQCLVRRTRLLQAGKVNDPTTA